MKGIIVVNPYLSPKESIHFAERLKEEFNKCNVDVLIESNGYLKTEICDNKIKSKLSGVDFVVFLDKDKYLASALSRLKVKMYNSLSAISVCDDKAQTYLTLANKGINIPNTVFAPLCYDKSFKIDENSVKVLEEKLFYPMIVKECYGSMGRGVYLANNKSELLSIMEDLKLKPHLYQKYLGYKKGVDIRVICVGGKVVASMQRENKNDFRSNIALGGTGKKIVLDKPFKDLAEKVAKTLKLDYCGVDLLYGENNVPYVCEVNSNAFIKEIESVTKINIAKKYVEYILN